MPETDARGHHRPPGRRRLRVLAAVLLVCSLSGCGGESVPTRAEVREKRVNDPVRRDSVSARVGQLRLLAVRIVVPAAGSGEKVDGQLFLTITSDGRDDVLTRVASVDADTAVLRDGDQPPEDVIDVPVPANGTVSMQDPDGLHLELVGLDPGGSFVPVTFRFQHAGAVTVKVLTRTP